MVAGGKVVEKEGGVWFWRHSLMMECMLMAPT